MFCLLFKGHKGGVDIAREFKPDESHLSEYLKSLPGESKIKSTLHCLECGKKCESQSALQAHHVTTHTKKTGEAEAAECRSVPLVFCRRCGAQFTDKEKLEEHMKTHIKEKRYSCPDCGKKFINESYIQVHQRIHTGEKPFLCSECGRGFHTASSLKLHEMRHSGERPYACSICGKTFRINSYLTAHYQTHIKDRPFVCSVCGKGYSRAEELKVHHRLHTGERPYECGQCGKSFIYRQGLRQHQRTHAGRPIGPTRQLGRPKQEARLDIWQLVCWQFVSQTATSFIYFLLQFLQLRHPRVQSRLGIDIYGRLRCFTCFILMFVSSSNIPSVQFECLCILHAENYYLMFRKYTDY